MTPSNHTHSRDRWALCLNGDTVGTVEDEQGLRWDTYKTEREAQLEIIDDLEIHIQQFKDGEREFDEIVCELYAMPCTEYPAEGILVFEDGTEYNIKDL